jgi:hypothetical protein
MGAALRITIIAAEIIIPPIWIEDAFSLRNICDKTTGIIKFRFTSITDIESEFAFIDSISINAAANIHIPERSDTHISE